MKPRVSFVPALWACGEVADSSVGDAHGDGLEADALSDATTPEADMSVGVTLDADTNSGSLVGSL